jgi:oligopeptidase A
MEILIMLATSASNPLLSYSHLPPYRHILPEHIEPAVAAVLQKNREELNAILANQTEFTWENLIQPMEHMSDRIDRVWGLAGHLNAVVNSEVLRAAYHACIPMTSDYCTEIGQNETLFRAIQSITQSKHHAALSPAQKKVLEHELRDFHLSGVDLPPEQKQQYRDIQQALSELTHRFEEHVLDATDAFEKIVVDESVLAGVPEQAKAQARQAAERKNQSGWLLTLEAPCYLAIMMYADHRELREEFYRAYVTRASELGTNPAFDNTTIMSDILKLRQQLAELLSYRNFSELSLATKMAKKTETVMDFLTDLARRAHPFAQREYQELQQFAAVTANIQQLQPWDTAYFSEKCREQRYALSQEELRPYFPAPHVINGLFELLHRLYGITFVEDNTVETWHDDVRFFAIYDQNKTLRGQVFIDLYARPQKRQGAWMNECLTRRRLADQQFQIPAAYVVCNFSGPVGDSPALFNHEEVLTLFHEFGHALHHLLTTVDAAFVSGTHGVAWDAVELPSQFMENWCYEKEVLDLISSHYQTGEKLPESLLQKMDRSRHFQSGLHMIRQLIYSVFDFRVHMEYSPTQGPNAIQSILDDVRKTISVEPISEFNRFQHSFTHIFSGGYAAGYYSYKWAEVLSSDAYSRFEEEGLFNPKVAQDFLHTILENGGAAEPADLFNQFRGREPTIDALLRHHGLIG